MSKRKGKNLSVPAAGPRSTKTANNTKRKATTVKR